MNVCIYLCSYTLFTCSCDLDLDLVILIYEPDTDIFKVCLHNKNEVSGKWLSTQTSDTDRQTDTHTDRQTYVNTNQ